jgi:hypothetical protein
MTKEIQMTNDETSTTNQIPNPKSSIPNSPRRVPELFQIVIQCASEAQQRDLWDRLRREGLKLRLLVL